MASKNKRQLYGKYTIKEYIVYNNDMLTSFSYYINNSTKSHFVNNIIHA